MGFLSTDDLGAAEHWARLAARDAVDDGRVDLGGPLDGDAAQELVSEWFDANKLDLTDATLDSLFGFLTTSLGADELDPTAWRRSTAGLTTEELVGLAETGAGRIKALRVNVVERDRRVVKSIKELGAVFLQRAIGMGLTAAISSASS